MGDPQISIHNFHIRIVGLDIIIVLFIHQTKHQCVVLKKQYLKFTLKELRHVSMLQLHHHQERINLCLLKLYKFV